MRMCVYTSAVHWKVINLLLLLFNMFSIIKFKIDDYICIYPNTKMKEVDNKFMVKWINKVWYEVDVLETGEKSSLEKDLNRWINSKETIGICRHPAIPLTPRIALTRITTPRTPTTPSDSGSTSEFSVKHSYYDEIATEKVNNCQEENLSLQNFKPKKDEPWRRNLFGVCSGTDREVSDLVIETRKNHPNSENENNLTLNADTNNIRKNKTKYHYCIYCKEKVQKLARHLERNHRSEDMVKQFLSLPKKNPERLNIITKIRNEGSFYFNTKVDENPIIVNRLPQHNSKIKDMSDYLPCPHCHGYYKKFSLRKHFKKFGISLGRQIQATSKSILPNDSSNVSSDVLHKDILSRLKNDGITELIKHDDLILKYGNLLCRKYATRKHLDKHIRNKLRMLARFVLTAKSMSPDIIDLSSCIDPQHFDTIISSINKLSGYDSKTGVYARPSLATITGTTIKQCAQKVLANAIKADDTLKEKARQFVELYNIEFGPLVASTAVDNIMQCKWNKPIKLPSVADIKKLNDYLDTKSEECFQNLKSNGFNINSWNCLMSLVLIKIMVFNRKRTGEIERLRIEQYNQKQRIEKDSDTYRTLLTNEQYLSQEFFRIEIRGKLGRRVPVLLRKKQTDYIDLIISMRNEAHVSSDNPYVFGKKDSHISACKEMRIVASNCGASNPELLRGTLLRKQIATISQTMNLSDNDVQILADFLGHDVAIHKMHYRKPDLALQTGKVSKLLIAAEDCNLNKYRGKNLDTLEVDKPNSVGTDSEVLHRGTDTRENHTDSENEDNLISNAEQTETDSDDFIKTCRNTFDSRNRKQALKNRTPIQIKSKTEGLKTKKSTVVRRTWNTPEKKAMRRYFTTHLKEKTLPPLSECIEILQHEPVLRRRTPDQIKAWVNNQNKKQIQ